MKTTILLPVISLFLFLASCTNPSDKKVNDQTSESSESGVTVIRKSKFPWFPERSVQFSGKRTKRSVQKKGCTQHL